MITFKGSLNSLNSNKHSYFLFNNIINEGLNQCLANSNQGADFKNNLTTKQQFPQEYSCLLNEQFS